MNPRIILTSDGSHSIYIPELDENYHSVHGAIQESKHVFIEAGLKYLSHPSINIFEVGLGTGLNAFLTFLETNNKNISVNYTAIEAFPITPLIAESLNYTRLLNATAQQATFDLLHSSGWELPVSLSGNFKLTKHKQTLQEIHLPAEEFDLIYFDAFGPPTQPEMWTEEIFAKIFEASKPNALLVTYCAKGEVKRTLKKVGFAIEALPGPPGKREMVRARK